MAVLIETYEGGKLQLKLVVGVKLGKSYNKVVGAIKQK